MAACFLGPEHQANKARINKLKVSVIDHRWGTVIKFLEQLLAVEDLVAQLWDFRGICDAQGWPHGAGAAADAEVFSNLL